MPSLCLFPAFLSCFVFHQGLAFCGPCCSRFPRSPPKPSRLLPSLAAHIPELQGHFAPGLLGCSLSPPPPLPGSAPSLSPVGRLQNHFKGSRTWKDETKLGHMVQSPDVAFLLPRPTSPLPAAGAAPRPFGQVHRRGEAASFRLSLLFLWPPFPAD